MKHQRQITIQTGAVMTARSLTGVKRSFPVRLPYIFIIGLLIAGCFLIPGTASAQTAAGTSIGNQASATYTDNTSVSRTATSNVVITIVQQVASLTLTANGARTASPGSPVFYPHTLTNTGNGSDSFTLTLAPPQSAAFTLTGTHIYLDPNGHAIPPNFFTLTTTQLPLTP